TIVQQLDHWKAKGNFAAAETVAELIRPPARLLVAQHRQADHRPPIPIIQPIVVNVHPLCKDLLALALHLDMHQDPDLLAVFQPYLEQFVRQPLAQFSLPDHLLEFLVKRLITPVPIDEHVDFGEKERQKSWEK